MAMLLTVLVAIVMGHDGRRAAQQLVLALPMSAWLLWPGLGPGWRRVRSLLGWVWAMSFVADGIVRAHLLDAYQAAPDSAMVLGAMSNTSPSESAEYAAMYWRPIASSAAWLVVAALCLAASFRARGASPPVSHPGGIAPGRLPGHRWRAWAIAALLLVSVVGYASKPWRSSHPWIFWSTWWHSATALRASWSDQVAARQSLLDRARAAQPVRAAGRPSTMMLVISESINRDNLAVYGYSRATTPGLLRQQASMGDALLVFKNAWSADASTLPALRNLFRFGKEDSEQPHHLLALARAAGYRVWWIGNQDDIGIEQLHARLADDVRLVNRTPGRSSKSPDAVVLGPVREAMADPSPHKLIVVHLMGAHPHYRHRFPPDANPFDDANDAVEATLATAGRPGWLRERRNEYDAALLEQGSVVSELLQLSLQSGSPADDSAWMYLSDHGQEVAHEIDHAGHSATTAAGYRIPTIVWQRHAMRARPDDLRLRPFRSDWTAWVIADLLGITCCGTDGHRNVLAANYTWQPPELPVRVKSFVD